MMDEREVLKTFIESKLLAYTNGEHIGYDEDLLMSGLVNSLGVLRLVTFVQEQFGIQIPAEDVVIEHFQTIDAIAAYLQSRRA